MMALRESTLVLTADGYRPVTTIKAGDVLRTPVGDATVILSRRQDAGSGPCVLLGNVALYGPQLVLTPQLGWSFARAKEAEQHYMKFGFNCYYLPIVPTDAYEDEANEVFSFVGPIPIVRPLPKDQPEHCFTWRLDTNKGMVVAEGCIIGRWALSRTDPTLPIITHEQLENFKNAYL